MCRAQEAEVNLVRETRMAHGERSEVMQSPQNEVRRKATGSRRFLGDTLQLPRRDSPAHTRIATVGGRPADLNGSLEFIEFLAQEVRDLLLTPPVPADQIVDVFVCADRIE